MRGRGRGVASATVVLALAAAARVWAAGASIGPARVRVVRAEGADPIILEISNRTRAELSAAGLDAAIVDCAGGDRLCAEARTDGGPIPDAVVTTARAGDDTVTEVKVPAGPPSLVLRLTVGKDSHDRDDPATLAVRAAELVQSALLQARAPAAPPPDAITYDFEQPRSIPPAADGTGWFLGAGGALLGRTAGFGPAVGLMMRGGYAGLGRPELGVGLIVAAPEWSADVQFPEGRAVLRQELAAAQLCWRFSWWPAVQPRISAGAGLYHLNARGFSDQPGFMGASGDAWSAVANLGAGVSARVGDALALFADAQVLVLQHYPVLWVDGRNVGAGQPFLLVSLGADWLF